jgi:hypothetical protein
MCTWSQIVCTRRKSAGHLSHSALPAVSSSSTTTSSSSSILQEVESVQIDSCRGRPSKIGTEVSTLGAHPANMCVCVCCFVCQLNFRFVLVESALVAMTCHDSIMWPRCVHGVCASLTALGWYEVPWLPSYHMCKTLLGVPTPTPCVSSSNIRSVETV